MAELLASGWPSIQTVIDNLDRYKTNPSQMQRVILDALDEASGGAVNIVDPNSPFVFLLEASTLNAAVSVNETNAVLTKMYPSLSQTEDDLYRHMSDKDYLNRFAAPSISKFTFVVQLNDVLNKMLWNEEEKAFKATIPRDTQFTVDDYTFTLMYPIDIRKYENGVIQISYDPEIINPISALDSNIIVPVVRRDATLVDWLFFDVKAKQIKIESTNFPIQAGAVFTQDVQFKDKFHYVRAFYRNSNTGNKWVEMKTTHTDQVYDIKVPTVCAKVYSGYVTMSIPMVYVNTGLVSGEVRFDVYTTKGNLMVNLSNYKPDSFVTDLRAIDEERDLNDYTTTMTKLAYYAYSADFVTGGSDGIDFATLRDRVINNSTGEQSLPITNKNVEAYAQDQGFTLVKNVDSLTNRIFLATQKLPKPTDAKLATAANVGISSFITNMGYLATLDTVKTNNNRATILSKNLYIEENGIIRILTSAQVNMLKAFPKAALVAEVNSQHYLYSPYYYVLDNTDNEFAVRAYDLDYPNASDVSFISQNQTLQLAVNTDKYSFTKIENGFRLSIVTASGNFYKQLDDANVFAQLAYYPVGESQMAYVNGVMSGKDANGNRIWTFDLETNYDIDSNNNICITNTKMFSSESINTWTELVKQVHILHGTNSVTTGFVPDESDALLGKFILPKGVVGNTHETLTLEIGHSLKALWARSRSIATGLEYERYPNDVPLYYEHDVYDVDPTTGSIFSFNSDGSLKYLKLHSAGDPVLDSNNNQIYKHRKGDVVLDENQKPIVSSELSVNKEIDLLFVDGRLYFVDDSAYVNYAAELVAIMDSWIVDDLANIQEVLLEETKIYFYPKTTVGKVTVVTVDKVTDVIPAEQSLVLNLYVKKDIYDNTSIRSQLVDKSISILDTYISQQVVNTTEIVKALSSVYGDSVQTIHLSGIGGDKDYQIVTLADEQYRLCLKKILYQQQDGSLILKEDVTVNFFNVTT